jgi:succinate-semialdehyde dehydrogenase/glutarate-semialdehyde dehydrogenase
MPVPSDAVFDRLRALASIADVAARPTKTVEEVFTGLPLATIPVGTVVSPSRTVRHTPGSSSL